MGRLCDRLAVGECVRVRIKIAIFFGQKLPKIAKKFTKIPKIVTSATMYIFHTVRYIARLTEKPIRSQKSQTSRGIQIEGI